MERNQNRENEQNMKMDQPPENSSENLFENLSEDLSENLTEDRLDRAPDGPSDTKSELPPERAPVPQDVGYLILQVSTARGAIPLQGAKVDIRSYEVQAESDPNTRGDLITTLISGRDGTTEKIALPAPPRSESATPGVNRPYALYQADVYLEGYYRQSYFAIPVFAGVTAIQPAVLIPLPENGSSGNSRPDDEIFFEGGQGNL